jgi:hypothetical protein
MKMYCFILVSLLCVFGFASANFEEKEVCVIGGGAAGSYTTWELQKRGYDVVLIEPLSDLGGNCEIVDHEGADVNAAVIIFSPNDVVKAFFEEFNAGYRNFSISQSTTNLVFSLSSDTLNFVAPQPPPTATDQVAIAEGLAIYLDVTNQDPYLVNGAPLDFVGPPDFSSLPNATKGALLQSWNAFQNEYPQVGALAPILSTLGQGLGYFRDLPMWQVLVMTPARQLAQLFSIPSFTPFVELIEGCQKLYDSVQSALLARDSTSVRTNTVVEKFRRLGNGRVLVSTKDLLTEEKSKIHCGKMIAAFRPIDMDTSLEKSFTKEERSYFSDLSYNGYLATVWTMQPGPSLLPIIAAAANGAEQGISFTNIGDGTAVVDTGIVLLTRHSGEPDYPWQVFYQPDYPPVLEEEKQALFDRIKMDLELIGFENVVNVVFKSHRYFVIPQSPNKLETFYGFMNGTNFGLEEQSVYYTGALLAGDATHYVYDYSKRLLDHRFPAQN